MPNLGGDVAFHPDFDDNCLVNVVAVGIVRERDVVRSRVPAEARDEPYVFVLVGKPTDASGFGGASFASAVLDEAEAASNKGAVQVPDPFLKRVLTEANRSVFELARAEGFAVGFKDLGAGGIACATSELAAAGGFGAEIELSSAAQDGGPFPPEVVACSETQERYCWVVPQRWAQKVLQIYNVDFELPHLYPGARAQVIGRVRTEDTLYRATHSGEEVCATTVETITEGIRYERAAAPAPPAPPEPAPAMPDDLDDVLAALLTGADLASRAAVYRHYDTEVQGRALIRPGEADAGLLAPHRGVRGGAGGERGRQSLPRTPGSVSGRRGRGGGVDAQRGRGGRAAVVSSPIASTTATPRTRRSSGSSSTGCAASARPPARSASSTRRASRCRW